MLKTLTKSGPLQKLNPVSGSSIPVGYKTKAGEKRNLVILKDKPINNLINEKVSSRALH